MADIRILTDEIIDDVGGDPTARSRARGGPLIAGEWIKLPAIYKLEVGGSGTISIDVRDLANTVTTNTHQFVVNGSEFIFPYFGDSVSDVKATITGTAFAEII